MRLKDVIVGGAMTAAGILYLRMGNALPERDGVEPPRCRGSWPG